MHLLHIHTLMSIDPLIDYEECNQPRSTNQLCQGEPSMNDAIEVAGHLIVDNQFDRSRFAYSV